MRLLRVVVLVVIAAVTGVEEALCLFPEIAGSDGVQQHDGTKPELEQAAESADSGQHLRPPGPPHEWPDALDKFVARIDIDAGILVSE